jgi:hypothetical protein
MPHLVLLGDSIFDNARYTSGGPDVVSQVRKFLPPGWSASLLATDGSTTDNITDQMQHLPDETTHLVLSIGGNNALLHASELGISLFGIPSTSNSDALMSLADISEDFEIRYRTAIGECLRPRLPLSVCTIYNGRFPDKTYQRIASVALTIFNDTILRVAIEHRLPVIDLRLICNEDQDYANSIEPSSTGGEKIARVIVTLVTAPETFVHATRVVSALHNESNPR